MPRVSSQNPNSGVAPEDPRILTPPFMNSIGDSDRLASRMIALRQFTTQLYRKPTSRELKAVEPNSKWKKIYSFVSERNGGIIRLLPDLGCARNLRVVQASEECIKLTMPGAANSYSFRTRSYRIKRLADIALDGEYISLPGSFMNAAIAELPDTEIQDVDLQSMAISKLAAIPLATNYEQIAVIQARIEGGNEYDGLRVSTRAAVRVGATYAYRGIAYRGQIARSAAGIVYNELDFDKRRDVIAVFKIVEVADDRSVTIVYRILTETAAPKIKTRKASQGSELEDRIK